MKGKTLQQILLYVYSTPYFVKCVKCVKSECVCDVCGVCVCVCVYVCVCVGVCEMRVAMHIRVGVGATKMFLCCMSWPTVP